MPIGPYFADFACRAARLVVEIDGAGHDDVERDLRKTAWLEANGWRVVRFGVEEVDESLDDVVHAIYNQLAC
jgi:very-short-patch-repair endonuclease